MSPARRQYIAAIGWAIGMMVLQGWSLSERIALGGMHPRTDAMQRQVGEHALANSDVATALGFFLFFCVTAHLALTMGATLVFQLATWYVQKWRNSFWRSQLFVALAALLAMFANRWLYPLSSAFSDVEIVMAQTFSPLLIGLVAAVVFAALSSALVTLARIANRVMLAVFGVLTAGIFVSACLQGHSFERVSRNSDRPDVIILGVDSLRPDFLPAYGNMIPGMSPAIDSVLAESVVVADARTPLARTFVSYMSLLTGENPVHHGARFNLYPRSGFDRSRTLSWDLKKRGYFSMLAMDESRFANFDKSFGFDSVIVPPVGALDLIVGGSFDFLATNLVIAALPNMDSLSVIQRNRAAYKNYREGGHASRVAEAIGDTPHDQPLFLISHLCLPHWPYLPSGVRGDKTLDWVKGISGFEDAPTQYLRAIRAADMQFSTIFAALKSAGRLENAVVIVMSDHGEDFGLGRDGLAIDSSGKRFSKSYGHGSFALSKQQNHVVMSIQRYRNGEPQWAPRTLDGPASIIDIAPTIASLTGASTRPFEGISWLPALDGNVDLPKSRIRYFENGLRSSGVERASIDERSVVEEMSYLYAVTADARFEIRIDALPRKLQDKQRGAVLGSRGVMTDPQSPSALGAGDCWQAIDYEKRAMSCVEFPSTNFEEETLQRAVCKYFGGDSGFAERWCISSKQGLPR